MKYFMIAGEASGDLHAASLIDAIRRRDPKAEFCFLGGDMMTEAANRHPDGSGQEQPTSQYKDNPQHEDGEGRTTPVVHYREMAYMGFVDVIKHLGKINANFKAARAAIDSFRPDCLILIDYPSFNLKMAKYAKRSGIPVYYYIPPKIWAWKQWRIKTIRRLVDYVFAIFPFEVDFYRERQYDKVAYVGNPSAQEIAEVRQTLPTREEFIAANHLQDKPLIALLPGSRLGEIRDNLRLMTQAMKQFPQYRGVVAGAPGVDPEYYAQYTHLPVVHGQTYALLASARAALVTSGTATLECSLIGTPQVAMYQGGGSKMLYNIMKRLLKIPFVTLPNLIVGRQVIPELLMHLCTADAAAQELGRILPDREARQQQLDGYAELRQILGSKNAPETAALLITAKTPERPNDGK